MLCRGGAGPGHGRNLQEAGRDVEGGHGRGEVAVSGVVLLAAGSATQVRLLHAAARVHEPSICSVDRCWTCTASDRLSHAWLASRPTTLVLGLQAKAEEDKKRVVALKADGGQAAASTPKPPRAPSAYMVRPELHYLCSGLTPSMLFASICSMTIARACALRSQIHLGK